MSGGDFDWSGPVTLRAYGSVAVHENPYGDVVIRQERGELEDEDHFVVVPVQDAEYVAHAIIRKAAEIKAAPAEERQQEREPRLALPPPAGKPQRPIAAKSGVA